MKILIINEMFTTPHNYPPFCAIEGDIEDIEQIRFLESIHGIDLTEPDSMMEELVDKYLSMIYSFDEDKTKMKTPFKEVIRSDCFSEIKSHILGPYEKVFYVKY